MYLVHQRWPDAFLANDLYDPDGTPAGVFPFLLMAAITADGRWWISRRWRHASSSR